MPPKPKFSKEEIIEAAFNIACEKGIDAVTAREIGAVLGVSTRPIFTYFSTMDELKEEIRKKAVEMNKKYIEEGLKMPIPFLGVGMSYIKFAKEQPELYKLLYLTKLDSIGTGAMDALKYSTELTRDSIMNIYHMDAKSAENYFRDMWLVGQSFATLIVTGGNRYTDEDISRIFSEMSISLCKAFKEIPGLADGSYDKEAVFRSLTER